MTPPLSSLELKGVGRFVKIPTPPDQKIVGNPSVVYEARLGPEGKRVVYPCSLPNDQGVFPKAHFLFFKNTGAVRANWIGDEVIRLEEKGKDIDGKEVLTTVFITTLGPIPFFTLHQPRLMTPLEAWSKRSPTFDGELKAHYYGYNAYGVILLGTLNGKVDVLYWASPDPDDAKLHQVACKVDLQRRVIDSLNGMLHMTLTETGPTSLNGSPLYPLGDFFVLKPPKENPLVPLSGIEMLQGGYRFTYQGKPVVGVATTILKGCHSLPQPAHQTRFAVSIREELWLKIEGLSVSPSPPIYVDLSGRSIGKERFFIGYRTPFLEHFKSNEEAFQRLEELTRRLKEKEKGLVIKGKGYNFHGFTLWGVTDLLTKKPAWYWTSSSGKALDPVEFSFFEEQNLFISSSRDLVLQVQPECRLNFEKLHQPA